MSLFHVELYANASHITRHESGNITTPNYVINIADGHEVVVEAKNSLEALEKGILAIQKYKASRPSKQYIDIVFTSLPGPVNQCQFVEVVDADGKNVRVGEWIQRPDGYHVLRIPKNINLG